MKKNIGTLVIILGIISGIIFFVSGSQLSKTGDDMKELRSQSGDSLAEVYYQDVGEMNKGLGTLADALGVGVMTLSIGIGAKLITDSGRNKISTVSDSKCDSSNEDLEKLGL